MTKSWPHDTQIRFCNKKCKIFMKNEKKVGLSLVSNFASLIILRTGTIHTLDMANASPIKVQALQRAFATVQQVNHIHFEENENLVGKNIIDISLDSPLKSN